LSPVEDSFFEEKINITREDIFAWEFTQGQKGRRQDAKIDRNSSQLLRQRDQDCND
jgi:hypothetical protein